MDPTQEIAEAITNIVKLMVDKSDGVSVEVVTVPGTIRYQAAPSAVGSSSPSRLGLPWHPAQLSDVLLAPRTRLMRKNCF